MTDGAERAGRSVPDYHSIEAAATVIAPVIEHTPLLRARWLSADLGAEIWVKAENLQRTGSFKIRGAYNCLAGIKSGGFAGGVIAASAGNHAQGVAFAARELGLPCTIVMPRGASLAKVVATERLGARVRLEGESFDDAYAIATAAAESEHLRLIPAFDDPAIIAGQGTIGLEILDSLPATATIVVPVGGGGLIAGIATAAKERNPRLRIVGVESSANPSYEAAVAAGEPVAVRGAQSIADGIAVKRVGALPFQIMQRFVDEVVLVHDDEIVAAMAAILERSKLVVEGAGAASVAALLAGRIQLPAGPVVAVLSGGNVDVNLVARVINYGLTRAGRYLVLTTRMADVPGALRRLLDLLAEMGVNVLDVSHHRQGIMLPVNEVEVELTLETRNHEHGDSVIGRLSGAGYAVQRESVPVGAHPADSELESAESESPA